MARRSAPDDGHAAVGLDDPAPAAHEEEARQASPVRTDREEDAGPARRPEGRRRRRGRPARSGSGSRPGRPSRGRSRRRARSGRPAARRRSRRRPGPCSRTGATSCAGPTRGPPRRPARSMTRLVGGCTEGAGRPARGARAPPAGIRRVVRAVGLHLGVDPQVRDAAEVAPAQPGSPRSAPRSPPPSRTRRRARAVRRRRPTGAGGADGAAAASRSARPERPPTMRCAAQPFGRLDPGPAVELEVRAVLGPLDERVPRGGVAAEVAGHRSCGAPAAGPTGRGAIVTPSSGTRSRAARPT